MEQNRKIKKWAFRYTKGDAATDSEIAALSAGSGLSTVMSTLLYTRGYRTAKQVEAFFRQETACLHDPYLMLDMKPAVERINQAIERGERIAIYGDYDVDGVTSVSLLYLYLTSYGADVGYYIPSRMTEGYGLSRAAIDRLKERGVKLMITVDTGITAIDETAYAAFLRQRAEERVTAVLDAPTEKSAGKENYEKKKREEAALRAEKKKRERAEARIPVIEAELERLKEELYGSAATDYTRAAEIEAEMEKLDEELLSLYELVM